MRAGFSVAGCLSTTLLDYLSSSITQSNDPNQCGAVVDFQLPYQR
jgi:hypothetical protein